VWLKSHISKVGGRDHHGSHDEENRYGKYRIRWLKLDAFEFITKNGIEGD